MRRKITMGLQRKSITAVVGRSRSIIDNRNRYDANGETYVVIGIAKPAAGNSCDTRFFESGECILSWPQLAPIINGRIVANMYLVENLKFFVQALQLCNQPVASQAIESSQLFKQPGTRLYQTSICHVA